MLLCTNETIVNGNAVEGEAHALRCKRWSCPICHDYNRKKVMHAAKRGAPNIFLTLTLSSKDYPDKHEAARVLKRGLVALRRRIERKWGIEKMPFIVVYEAHKSGHPHMHLLIRAPYMHWKVLKGMWRDITGSTGIDVRYIKRKSQVLFYVTKYIGKSLGKFEGCKRWWRSHNYEVVKEEYQPPHLYGDRFYRINWSFDFFCKHLDEVFADVEFIRGQKVRWWIDPSVRLTPRQREPWLG